VNPDVAAAVERLGREGTLTPGQAALFGRVARDELVSVRPELRAVLYGGVLAVMGGVGVLVQQNLDRLGPVAIAVGLWLWASELSKLTSGGTLAGMLVTGAGFGLAMSALNTDALNRAPKEIRGEASGIVQTFRNFGSALGMAILGTIVLGALGPHTTASGFADALETAFKVGAIVMAVSFVISRVFMPSGKQADVE